MPRPRREKGKENMEHIITLAIHAAQRPAPDATEHNPAKVYGGFAAVSSTSTRPEGPTAGSQMIASGQTVYQETSRRQLVKIELPEGVEASPYTVGGVKLYGLHASAAAGRAARDGMGSAVYVYVRTPASVHEAGSDEAAFAEAIKSGVMLSVPQADGTRKGIPVKVLSVSPVYTDRVPADWASQLSAQIDRKFGKK